MNHTYVHVGYYILSHAYDRDLCWPRPTATGGGIGGDTMQLLGQQFPLTHIPLHAFPSIHPPPPKRSVGASWCN